jgi:transglutaminase superfamily protein
MCRAMDDLAFYAAPGPMTELPRNVDLPSDMAGIAPAVRGLMLHRAKAVRLGIDLTDERRGEERLRSASAMIAGILDLDPAPLRQARPPERQLIINCRHVAVLACALLRRVGRPARARVGFATYLDPGRYVDHWIVERWHDGRWLRSDADPPPQSDFDPLNLPPGRFLSAAEAWRRCRSGDADPELFGVESWWGAWMIRNNVVRDLAALNRVELLPWDGWGLMDRSSRLGEGPADVLVDDVAARIEGGELTGLRRLYESDDRLRAPASLV